ncbi:alginate lyase family protein [Vibrio sp. D404a]|uniref:alginate lyase family protein n=1 Tax=unclassified Vibrio TaxID=2614977 RepID=UPI002555EE9D|nr:MULTISPECIES: alginate lyase family protein [unclassified Vibrio]MDK9738518.1 alginate lyase family protein [Vibrio sp. D404a]MDK9796118.1 alginate lyase family protein [Vibrio sp. D449a]
MKALRPLHLAACIGAITFGSNVIAADFVFLDEATLEANRTLLQSEQAPSTMKVTYDRLLEEAELAMQDGPFSVADKGMTPPSGNKNDYMSISPYWWPDKSKEDGLPWVRHDGKTNPASKTDETDSKRIGHFTRSVRALAIAYYFSQDEKYAQQGIEYIRTWFINEETKMNPNVNYGQGVPGVAEGRRGGIIDTRTLADRMLDSIAMLSQSPSWTEKDEEQIKQWYSDYLDWLIVDDLSGGPKGEAYAENNHGTWYDYQVASIAYFIGNEPLAKQMVQKGKMRIDTQFEKDGSQPHEIERTRAYHYHYFSLDPLVGMAQIGEKVDVDLWNYTNKKGGSLETGIQLMATYHDLSKEWPYTQKDERRRIERMTPLYLKAGVAMDKPEWVQLATETDFSEFTVKKNLAEVWAQRDIELLYPKL